MGVGDLETPGVVGDIPDHWSWVGGVGLDDLGRFLPTQTPLLVNQWKCLRTLDWKRVGETSRS